MRAAVGKGVEAKAYVLRPRMGEVQAVQGSSCAKGEAVRPLLPHGLWSRRVAAWKMLHHNLVIT